jgi:hypothetical protein
MVLNLYNRKLSFHVRCVVDLAGFELEFSGIDLDTTASALRASLGTEDSLIAAYGVHVNPEISALDAATLYPVIRAFCLLQWWLVDRHDVDATRKLSPYIDLYPAAYVKQVLTSEGADLTAIVDGYLEHNATRNRALDLLPLLSLIDERTVRKTVDDPRIKSRPTFHYRMADCHIEREDWSLTESWNTWCVVEKLADRGDDLDALAREFLDADRLLRGVNRGRWVEFVGQWLEDRGLA